MAMASMGKGGQSRVHGYGAQVMITRHKRTDHVPYDDWQGWPDICELHACPRAADESQVAKVWRSKNDGSPTPAHVDQSIPGVPGRMPWTVISQSIEIEYLKENIVRKYVDLHAACPHSQQ